MLTSPLLTLLALSGPLGTGAFDPSDPTRFHWGDVDRDGQPDAVAIEPGGTLRLLLGDAEGRFLDATVSAGLENWRGVQALVLGDWSGDGNDDLALATPLGLALLRFTNGSFVDATLISGIDSVGSVTSVELVDANGDGLSDLHVVADGWHHVYASVPGADSMRFEKLDLGAVAASENALGTDFVTSRTDRDALTGGARRAQGLPTDAQSGRQATGRSPVVRPVGAGGSNQPVVVTGGVTTAPGLGGYGSANPIGTCAGSVTDQATGFCVQASSTPTLGFLYPLGDEFMIDSATGFVGVGTTTPGYPLEIAGQVVSGTNNTPTGPGSAIGGGTGNNATGEHATIAGGEANQALGDDAFIGGGASNLVVGQRAVIGGGVGNSASNSAVVGGGEQNTAFNFATVAGGRSNDASAVGSTVGGGANNEASGLNATVAGGGDATDPLLGNTASGIAANVGGGQTNAASGNHATVAGGQSNNATVDHATVGGGLGNAAFAPHATVPGGRLNVAAGVDSFAAGRRAKALHDGAFVWADSTDADFASTGTDQFIVRAAGGMGVGISDPAFSLHVVNSSDVKVASGGSFVIGQPTGDNLAFDGNEIMARSAGAVDILNLNFDGGDVVIGDATSTIDVRGELDAGSVSTDTFRLNPPQGGALGYVLTSDFSGKGSWQPFPGGGGPDADWLFEGNDLYSGPTGSVGIGQKTTYAGKLHVDAGGGSVAGYFELADTGVQSLGGALGVDGTGTDPGGIGVRGQGDYGVIGVKTDPLTPGWAIQSQGPMRTDTLSIGTDDTSSVLVTRSTGAETNTVLLQDGTGPILEGFNDGGTNAVFRVDNDGRAVCKVLEITGGADLVESFETGGQTYDPGSVLIVDSERVGHLTISRSAYDTKVAGVVSGAGGVQPGIELAQADLMDGDTPVALTGRVWVKASAENGAIVPGDMLTTASLEGHAMRVTELARSHGTVIGKAMSRLDEGTGLVLVLVNLQ